MCENIEQEHEQHGGAGNITTWSCLLIIEAGKVTEQLMKRGLLEKSLNNGSLMGFPTELGILLGSTLNLSILVSSS